jgi:hypothetical protein
MILGIMQPYFFPYLGYFELIGRTDRWVVFDVVQYNSKSWMNRNRILHPKQGWQYITVPVEKAPRGTLIRDMRVKDMKASQDRVLGQLMHYKKKAPFFRQTCELVRAAFAGAATDGLRDLNVSALSVTCAYLGIPFHASICSEMGLNLSDIADPGQWALRISEQLGAEKYINPPGGKAIFNPEEWKKAGIDLEFTEMPKFRYDCAPYEFIEHLSILDVLMWNAPKSIRSCLDENDT